VNDKIAILGVGPLASILAHRIPSSARKVIIGRPKAAAVALADEVGGIASDQASAVRGCRVVFVTAPSGQVAQALAEIQPHLSAGALVVNMATELTAADLAEAGVPVAAAKVIGHPGDMAQGAPGVVVLDQVDGEEAALLESLLAQVGPVVRGDERMVQAALDAIDAVMREARDELQRRLEAVGLSPEAAPVAIAAAAPGVLRALAAGKQGTVGREVWRFAGADETAASLVSQ